jgi:hypothetical protein
MIILFKETKYLEMCNSPNQEATGSLERVVERQQLDWFCSSELVEQQWRFISFVYKYNLIRVRKINHCSHNVNRERKVRESKKKHLWIIFLRDWMKSWIYTLA